MIFSLIYLIPFIASLFLALALYKVRRTAIGIRLSALTALVAYWLVMEGLSFYVDSPTTILLFQKLKYIGVILVSPTLLVTSVIFIHKLDNFPFKFRVALFFLPALSLLSVFTNHFPYSFVSNPKITFEFGIPVYTYNKEIGFLIHTGYSYLLILFTCYLLFVRALQSPKIYRIQSLFVFLGCTVTVLINVLFVTGIFGVLYIDTTPISILITLLIFYWGVFSLPVSKIVPYARNLVIENMSDLAFIVDNADAIIDVNPSAKSLITTYSTTFKNNSESDLKLTGMNIFKLLETISPTIILNFQSSTSQEQTVSIETAEGIGYYKMSNEVIYDADHIQIGRLFMLHDITEMQNYLSSVVTLNEKLTVSDKIIEDALEGIIITDSDNRIIRVNHSMEKMSGYAATELMGQNPNLFKSQRHDFRFYQDMWDALRDNGFWEGEIWDKKKNGELYPKWMSITTILDPTGKIVNYIGVSSDISKMKKAEHDIQLLAYYDSLTGIPNRTLFYDRLHTALTRCKRSNQGVALFFIDLDRFKMINDTLGHSAGDEVLITVSKRIKHIIRETDTLSRLGGDEFTLILESIQTPNDAKRIAENILAEIQKPFHIMGREVTIDASIGIALAPFEEMTAEGMIRKADMAMYHAKETGGSKYIFSSEEIEKRNHELYAMQLKLKEALKNNEFQLYLQPQLALREGKYVLTGAEALIRWRTKNGEMIPPVKFIPIAEGNGMIIPIGNWVIEEVFRIDRRLKSHLIDIKLAFNISVKQFENKGLIDFLKEQIDNNQDLNPNLSAEITESLFINDLEKAIHDLNSLKHLGIKIALDDFGTGFSSMSYLTKLPIDTLKIDQSFVSDIEKTGDKNLAFMIIAMAKTLNLQTVAEGVETTHQLARLEQVNCDIIQGYYFGKPMPVEEFITLYKDSFSKPTNSN